MNKLGCDCEPANPELVEQSLAGMPASQRLQQMTEFFKVIGDDTRLRILASLRGRELCVSDIANVVDMSKSAVSHQLRVLKQAKLVKFRREGKTVYYSLADEHVRSIISMGMVHLCE